MGNLFNIASPTSPFVTVVPVLVPPTLLDLFPSNKQKKEALCGCVVFILYFTYILSHIIYNVLLIFVKGGWFIIVCVFYVKIVFVSVQLI